MGTPEVVKAAKKEKSNRYHNKIKDLVFSNYPALAE